MPHPKLKRPAQRTKQTSTQKKRFHHQRNRFVSKRGLRKSSYLSPRSLSHHPSDLEISTARVFLVPLTPIHTAEVTGENEALAKALIAFKGKIDPDDVYDLTKFIADYPKSRWRASLELNLGRRRFETGYLTEALADWGLGLKLAKNETTFSQRVVADEAAAEALMLKARLGKKTEPKSDLEKLKKRHMVPSVASKILNAHGDLLGMENAPEKSFKCGPFALDSLLSSLKGKRVHHPLVFKTNSTDKGTNLAQVKALSDEVGLHYQVAKRSPGAPVIVPAVLHYKLDHFAALTAKVGVR